MKAALPSWEPHCDSRRAGSKAGLCWFAWWENLPYERSVNWSQATDRAVSSTGITGLMLFASDNGFVSNLAHSVVHSGVLLLDQESWAGWRNGSRNQGAEAQRMEGRWGCKILQPRKTPHARNFPVTKIPPRSEKNGTSKFELETPLKMQIKWLSSMLNDRRGSSMASAVHCSVRFS